MLLTDRKVETKFGELDLRPCDVATVAIAAGASRRNKFCRFHRTAANNLNSRCNIGATRRGRSALTPAPDLGRGQTRGGLLGSQERAKEPPRHNHFNVRLDERRALNPQGRMDHDFSPFDVSVL